MCVFCMFHYVLAWRTYNRIILLHVCAEFHSHAANKCYDVLSEAEGGNSWSWSTVGNHTRKQCEVDVLSILIRLLCSTCRTVISTHMFKQGADLPPFD